MSGLRRLVEAPLRALRGLRAAAGALLASVPVVPPFRPVYAVTDEGGERFYSTLEEAMLDAGMQIEEYRSEAYYDGEWSYGVEDVCVWRCWFPTEEPEEDGELVARAKEFEVPDPLDDERLCYDYRMVPS